MQESNITFFSYETLIDRLAYAATSSKSNKRIVFLLGSPVSASFNGNPGVPNVDGIVESIRQEFISDNIAFNALENELTSSSGNAYQVAMNFLMGRRGQDAVNELIRDAVIGACNNHRIIINDLKSAQDPEEYAKQLEQELDKWHVPNCLQDLATLCIKAPGIFGYTQLTTNFDPLLKLALKTQGGSSYRSILSRDGSLAQAQGDGCHLVHLHGYWCGADTLHTPRQLNQPRPRLKASLSELLRNCIVVPVAYSGWDDVFTRTLIEIMNEDGARPEILWTYYGDNENDLLTQNNSQICLFSAGLDSGRLQLFKGVNCHELFSDLSVKLGFKTLNPLNSTSLYNSDSFLKEEIQHLTSHSIGKGKIEITHSDSIPSVADLVGRIQELSTLIDPQNKLVAIGGIGGQGKSSLAAYHALSCRTQNAYEFVEWRDCREQNDTLHTIFLKTAHSLSGESDAMEMLKELSIDDLTKQLCKLFETRKGLIIFDNVDHYVDLQTGSPLRALKTLIDSLQPQLLQTQLVFTARPLLKFESSNATSFMLKGLTDKDAQTLFEQKSGTSISENDFIALKSITEGHPLWITLIASRCRQQKVAIKTVIDEITSGKGDLPERTLLSIWNSLNDKQKIVLRTMAELERPLPEKEVCEINFELQFNQFTKALRVLKGLGLVELRQQERDSEVLDLHPLIRQYIRTNFPRPEREKFISMIICVFDRRLSDLRKLFKTSFPVSVLELWTHKVALNLNGGQIEAAIESLVEISTPLVQSGQSEEFVRLSIRVFEEINWALTCATSKKFHKMWADTIQALSELDDFERADMYITRYKESIEGTGIYFLNLCNSTCYRYWFAGEFEQAIFYGEKGVSLKNSTNVDTSYDCSHYLALAWRDQGGRVEEALQYFIGQNNEQDVLDPQKIDNHRGGSYYGNIGRCFYLKDDIENALICYRKSALLLEQARDEVLNRGYIRQWVGQALQHQGYEEESVIFQRAAHCMWKGFIPQKATTIESELKALVENNPKLEQVMELPIWRLENRFQQWCNKKP